VLSCRNRPVIFDLGIYLRIGKRDKQQSRSILFGLFRRQNRPVTS
jgi:hypothetical protein